jgi:hypothetical protein
MRNVLTTLGLILAASAAACGGKKTENGTGSAGSAVVVVAPGSGSADLGSGAGSGSAVAAGSGSAGSGSAVTAASGSGSATDAGSGSGSADVAFTHHAGNCPSTVFGATTKDELKAGKIIVTISATDKEAIATIQKRADELLKDKADNLAPGSTTSHHDQKGTHGGGMGMCPIFVPEGANAVAQHDAKGVVVTITPAASDKPADFKGIVDARITKASEWLKANVKGGAGNEGGVGPGDGPDSGNHTGKGDGKGKQRHAGSGSAAP